MYRYYLEQQEEEWENLDRLTHISISRFFRDRKAWEELGEKILPSLALQAGLEKRPFRCWSAGCASGEEPYSFAILWKNRVISQYPELNLDLVATDANEGLLKRAVEAHYSQGSLKEVPDSWMEKAFEKEKSIYRLKKKYSDMVDFYLQDIRKEMPEGYFDVIFCKNLVAMYFREKLAINLFHQIIQKLRRDGFLVLGNHEKVPEQASGRLVLYDKGSRMYQKKENL
jgi:chemotaxis protein methyltransferase CheR